MDWRLVAILVAAVIAAGFVLDRLLLAAEERGWIYWRRHKPESGALSNAAFGPVFDVLQPTREVAAEEREHQRLVRHETGLDEDEEPGRSEGRQSDEPG